MSALIYREAQIAYWPILKCASTSLKRALLAAGFEDSLESGASVPREWTSFTIVRDPVERYLAAVWSLWSPGGDVPADGLVRFEQHLVNVLEDNIAFGLWTAKGDPHMRPQVDSIPGDRAVTHFVIEDLALLPEWLRERGVQVDAAPERLNARPGAVSELMERLVTDQDRAVIRQGYARDEVLYRFAIEMRRIAFLPGRPARYNRDGAS